MTYLFIFAHPDDETVACAATIKQLVDAGEEVIIVSATDGSAGEVHERAQQKLAELKSIGALRRYELQQVAQLLNVNTLQILDFIDGEITNQKVWGELTTTFINVINQYKPDVVVTFDHSGWYFHLDHVGVSIATTLAVQQAKHQTPIFLFAHVKVSSGRWKYVFPKDLPVTHIVDATSQKDFKLRVLDLHASQDLERSRQRIIDEKEHQEWYQLVSITPAGKKLFKNHPIFRSVKS